MCWLLQGVDYDGCFNGVIETVLWIGLAPRGLNQGLYASFFIRVLVTLEGVTGNAHDFACPIYIAQLTGRPCAG